MKKITFFNFNKYIDVYKIIFNHISENFKLDISINEVHFKVLNNEYLNKSDITYTSYLTPYNFDVQLEDIVYYPNLFFNSKAYDIKRFSILKLLEIFEINIENKNILILELGDFFENIYSSLKELNPRKINISTIKENIKFKLNKGDSFKKKVDSERLENVDLLINDTEIGDMYSINETPIKLTGILNPKYLLDLNLLPLETTLMSLNKNKGNISIGGLYLAIIECLKISSILFSKDLVTRENINKIYNNFIDELNKN